MSTVSTMRMRARLAVDSGRRPLFYVVTAGFLAFLVFALNEPLRFAVFAWMPGYEAFTHRVHHVTLGSALWLFVLGVAVQLYRPARRVGAYLLAASFVAAVAVVSAVTGGLSALLELAVFIVPLAIIGVLHPGIRSFRPSWAVVDRRMLVLAVIAAVPLAAFAAMQANLQLIAIDDHALFEHYLFMAASALLVGIGAILASFRPAGWRALVYGVAALLTIVGVASVLFADPVQGPTFGTIGGILAVMWAIVFVVVAEYGARQVTPSEVTTATA